MAPFLASMRELFESLLFGDRWDLRGCGQPFVARTPCCRRRMCRDHAHRWDAARATGSCPVPGCRG